jgi:RecB family endonuclease NucS
LALLNQLSRGAALPILINSEVVLMCAFSNEAELEQLLEKHPELLGEEEESIAFVDRQIPLEAGKLDLLFVNSDGLPIVVETKRSMNPDARRQVIGQVIDYLASLTDR